MIVSFTGDSFLVTRAARRYLREQGLSAADVVELGEGMDGHTVSQQAAQGGLFGRVAVLLDFAEAFSGKAGIKPRNEVMSTLSELPPEPLVVVMDPDATAARQKRFKELGEHEHLPTPRFGALNGWVRRELQDSGVKFSREVPDVLADLFGEDLPGIAGEITKLATLDEELSGERVREIAGRLASRDAFDLIEAVTKGDSREALRVCDSLLAQGEAPPRVLAALVWQFDLVAKGVALREERTQVSDGEAASALGAKPFVAKKAMAIANRLNEEQLRRVLGSIVRADQGIKTGANDRWSLESLALELSELFSLPPAR